MSVEESGALLQSIANTFRCAGILVYEQIHPHDAFGQTMQKNLLARGCPLLSLLEYPELADQKRRFENFGWSSCEALDMLQVWDELLDCVENRTVERLEMFDELEEWRLIQSHYCLVLATFQRDSAGPGFSWSNIPLRRPVPALPERRNELPFVE